MFQLESLRSSIINFEGRFLWLYSNFVVIKSFKFGFQECAAKGEDYNRVKLLEITADEAERWERKKKKKNPDTGFAGWLQSPSCIVYETYQIGILTVK